MMNEGRNEGRNEGMQEREIRKLEGWTERRIKDDYGLKHEHGTEL